MRVELFTDQYKKQWDEFVSKAKNSHFFFYRDFMEYHKDRFEDFSLIIRDDKDNILALLPANRVDKKLYTHQGLTFGGLITSVKMKSVIMLEIFQKLKSFLLEHQIDEVIYKCIPCIYHTKAAQEDRYALFREEASLIETQLSATIYLDKPLKYSNGRKWRLKKVKQLGLEIKESENFTKFWDLLHQILDKHHGAKPVHTLKEITYLHQYFPKHIKLFEVYKEDQLMCGGVVFENEDIAHLQYVANSDEGRKIGALDLLIDHLIKTVYNEKKYFDFGTSNEDEGKVLNEGLIDQKERFGASGVVHDTFLWKLR